MSMAAFIEENAVEIDAAINRIMYRYDGNGGHGVIPDPPPTYDDDEREQWIANDEDLYRWALLWMGNHAINEEEEDA
jgi:hypothetical protein